MHLLANIATLLFLGDIHLEGLVLLTFILCLLVCISFEFVNGFHDTANAVATVIYTKALKPQVAVPWSGCWNFIGVLTGGVAVAMGILKLVPLSEMMDLPVAVGAALVMAILVASTLWNLGTWYLGIPCSSSHTLIGAMIGGGLAFSWYYGGSGVNWGKAQEIGLSLLFSPFFGFGAAVLLMWLLRHVLKVKQLFRVPEGENDRPPLPVRVLLIITCTLVSYFHGSNDGQKGIGLMMLILIAFLPAKFAIDHSVPDSSITGTLTRMESAVRKSLSANPGNQLLAGMDSLITVAKKEVAVDASHNAKMVFGFRKHIQAIGKMAASLTEGKFIHITPEEKREWKKLSGELKKVTDYAPVWVVLVISLALGIGTMVGWKRIVVTIGEKIGKEHLNYAQGATAELVAATTIGLSTGLGLPVSTTHVLSSGIAGTMVASNGTKNLNNKTLKNIALAWVLTLPVCIALAFLFFLLFHLFI